MFLSAGVAGASFERRLLLLLAGLSLATVTRQECSAGILAAQPRESAYEPPAILTATIYPDSGSNQPLFTFKRSMSQAGSDSVVLGEYSYPDGKVAVRERVFYANHLLSRYEVTDFQTGASGSATIERDPHNPLKGTIVFRHAKDSSSHAASATRTEPLLPDTLVSDMVGPFIASHWDRLSHQEKVMCRCIVVSHSETVGFTFRKESERHWHGRDVAVLKMEASNLLVSVFVDPLWFIVEKDPPHRVLQYTGRTVPKTGQNRHWKDLDAVTVFNW